MTRNASKDQLEWEQTVSRHITSDVIWKLEAYRSALFLVHLVKTDVKRASRDPTRTEIIAQLRRASGGISGHVGEGYSRPTRADRLRFLNYAVGSARECVSWYASLSDLLDPPSVIESRFELLARIRMLAFGMIRSQRNRAPNEGLGFEP